MGKRRLREVQGRAWGRPARGSQGETCMTKRRASEPAGAGWLKGREGARAGLAPGHLLIGSSEQGRTEADRGRQRERTMPGA